MTEYIVVLITASKEEEAANIAKEIVDAKLAGCVNIIKDIRSIYRWQGRMEDEKEVLMFVKTRRDLFVNLAEMVKRLHSYSVPEIIALPVTEGSKDYLKWLEDETTAGI